MEKFNEDDAMLKCFDYLIKTFQETLDQYINDYNDEMIKEAMKKIVSDIKEVDNYTLGLSIEPSKNINIIKSNIGTTKKSLQCIINAKERYLFSQK